jgi:hypothetical protein
LVVTHPNNLAYEKRSDNLDAATHTPELLLRNNESN